jgi:hypothetical protein
VVGWEGNLPQRGDDYANFTYPRGPVQGLWEEIRTFAKIVRSWGFCEGTIWSYGRGPRDGLGNPSYDSIRDAALVR